MVAYAKLQQREKTFLMIIIIMFMIGNTVRSQVKGQ